MASPSHVRPESLPVSGQSGTKNTIVQFGAFELDLATNELRKQGIRVRLQSKPCDILRALVENPGAVVSREELRHRLWPENTFVDFERSLNSAVNRLRIVLGDSANNPRYVETLSRSGYRFLAPVTLRNMQAASTEEMVAKPRPRLWVSISLVVTVAAAIAGAMGAYVVWKASSGNTPRFRQVTFQRAQVSTARFSSDSEVVYSARGEGGEGALFLTNSASPESRSLGFRGMRLAAISSTSELAMLKSGGTMNIAGSELFRVPLNGGDPVRVDEHIMGVDWAPGGKTMALVRAIAGTNQLEYPPGTVLYRTPGWLSDLRFSPDGSRIAFVDHPIRHDDRGDVKLVDTTGRASVVSQGWADVAGLAWHPATREIWFTGARGGSGRSIWATSPRAGKPRSVASFPGAFTLCDIASNGRLLLSTDTRRLEMAGLLRGFSSERSLSWLDWSRVQSVSRDGGLLLFDESGEAVGSRPVSYLYQADAGSTHRIGEGLAQGLAPDGRWVLVIDADDRRTLKIVPIAGGPPKAIRFPNLVHQWARLSPNGKEAIALSEDREGALGLFVLPIFEDKPPARIAGPIMVRNLAISPTGDRVAALTPSGKVILYSTKADAEPVELPAIAGMAPLLWSSDGAYLYLQDLRRGSEPPSPVVRFHLMSGKTAPWRVITPPDRIGVNSVTGIVIAEDEKHYVYSYRRVLADLFTVDGLR
ncbi:MAG: hypothetical protein EXQ52_01430 [Bryobacterales bacterium]|nr:hypothetical protein [Bryobacterales bacterium]